MAGVKPCLHCYQNAIAEGGYFAGRNEGQGTSVEILRVATARRTSLTREYVPKNARTATAMPVLFALNMLLRAEQINVFTLRQNRVWRKAAGFRKMATIPVPPPSNVILANQ